MINDIEKYELIEKYLLNKASDEEKKLIDNLLLNDPDFKQEFELHKEIQNTIIDYKLLELKTQLQQIYRKKNRYKNINGKNILFFISGIILLSTIIYFITLRRNDGIPSADPGASKASGSLIVNDTIIKHTIDNNRTSKNTQKNNESKLNSSNYSKKLVNNESTTSENNNLIADEKYENKTVQAEIKFNDTLKNVVKVNETVKKSTDNIICNLEANYHTVASCNTHPSGKIVLTTESIKGGTPPYSLFLNDKKVNTSIENLSPGIYKVKLIDSKNCVFVKEIKIDVEDCFNEFVFSPSLNELWEIPVKYNKKGIIKIFDKFGKLVFQKIILTGNETWDGNDINNIPLPSGLYLFVIYYDDGEIFKGSVTIIR